MLPDHEQTQKRFQKLQSLEDTLAQSWKHTAKKAQRTEQARIVTEKLRAEMEDDGKKVQAENAQ